MFRRATRTMVYLLYVRDATSEWPSSLYLTEDEINRAEVEAHQQGIYEKVTWEEQVVHDPRGAWDPSQPVYVATDGVYEVTLGVFSDHADALACLAGPSAGGITQIHTMHVTRLP